MTPSKPSKTYIAFLRGINVGGHHKVPMADLKVALKDLGFEQIETLLNSGNVIFKVNKKDSEALEKEVTTQLERVFQFPIPTIIHSAENISQLYKDAPFAHITMHKDIRLYVSFLKQNKPVDLKLPWKSEDESYQILSKQDRIVLSVLDMSTSKTPKAMEALEKQYGKDITTRNWNTIERIVKKLDANG